MIRKNQSISIGEEVLSSTVIGPNISTPPSILMLHGAGFAQRKLSWPLVEELAQSGRASITFDFSGHGESTANTVGSLSKRVEEASAVLEKFKESISSLIAFSMSGYVALHIAQNYHPENIILFAPAIYDTKAYDIPFGSEFSSIIRTENSWRESDTRDLMKLFTGKLLIYIGERDDVIPREVVDTIYHSAVSAKEKKIRVLPNVGHRIAHAMQSDPVLLETISTEVIDFLVH